MFLIYFKKIEEFGYIYVYYLNIITFINDSQYH